MTTTLTQALQADIDRDGRLHIGNPRKGCWSCGSTRTKVSACGRVTLHHPSTECCAPAIKRLITLNRQELERHRNDARDFQNAIADLDEKAATRVGKDAADARQKADSMRRAFDTRQRDHWSPIVDGAHGEPGLKHEITRLERKLRDLEATAA